MVEEGFVLQACHGRKADGPYYAGDGEWTAFDGAKIYYSRRAMRIALSEANKNKPDDKAEIKAFGVYV